MIITRISNGFGNQLFQYSFGYAVSRRLRVPLALDAMILDNHKTRKYELNTLNINIEKVYTNRNISSPLFRKVTRIILNIKFIIFYHLFKEKKPFSYDADEIYITDHSYLDGFWQSEKYFKDYRNDLLKQITPKLDRSESVKRLYDEMDNCCSVALHVRRGDYVEVGCQLNMDYYNRAISKIKSRFINKKTVFYVFSDDVSFCKKYFENSYKLMTKDIEFRYPKYESDNYTVDDLFLMSKCHHMIMANSSYSWWAAWLNQNEDKTVICPELQVWKGDFYPDDWIKIKCE